MEARIVVVLMREEERLNGALITDSLFGFAYLVLLISCDAAATMVRVSTKTPYNGPKHVRKHGLNAPTFQRLVSVGFWPLDTVSGRYMCT